MNHIKMEGLFMTGIKELSAGKLKVNLDSIDHWVRLPKTASSYNLANYEGQNENNKTQSGNTIIAQLFIKELSSNLCLVPESPRFNVFGSRSKNG